MKPIKYYNPPVQEPIYKPQVKCPSCGHLSAIDYCYIGVYYIWWCENILCGKQYKFIINSDWSVKAKATGVFVTATKVTLKLPPQKEDIYITINGGAISGNTDNDEYFYNEHDCPANFLKNIEEIRIGYNEDPHGIFRYVKTEILNKED